MIVHCTPKPTMLRHGEQKQAARLQRTLDLFQHGFVFFDMLNNIKSADSVKFFPKRNFPRIHLQKFSPGNPFRRKGEAFCKNLTADQTKGRKTAGNALQHKSGATADFHKRCDACTVFPESPDDQCIACSKPEMARFPGGQRRKV